MCGTYLLHLDYANLRPFSYPTPHLKSSHFQDLTYHLDMPDYACNTPELEAWLINVENTQV